MDLTALRKPARCWVSGGVVVLDDPLHRQVCATHVEVLIAMKLRLVHSCREGTDWAGENSNPLPFRRRVYERLTTCTTCPRMLGKTILRWERCHADDGVRQEVPKSLKITWKASFVSVRNGKERAVAGIRVKQNADVNLTSTERSSRLRRNAPH